MTPISPLEPVLALSQQVEKLKAELAAAQQQAAESAALAERLRNVLSELVAYDPLSEVLNLEMVELSIEQTPFAALAQYRDGVLEEVAKWAEDTAFANVDRWELAQAIRAMKGTK